jgi:hypothetical protein
VGGVPQVEFVCPKCEEREDLKLHPPTWMSVFPPPE